MSEALSQGQREYLRGFEAMLRTGRGIDFCVELAERIGVKIERSTALRTVHHRKLTPNEVREIRIRSGNGEHTMDLAREYGLSRGATRAVINRETWREVN
jgi:hypothetical protein